MATTRDARKLRPRATGSLAVAPAAVSDRTAPLVLGLEPRAFRELVVRLHIRHVRIGRRVLATVADVLAALDGAASADQEQAPVVPDGSADGDLASVDDFLGAIGRKRRSTG